MKSFLQFLFYICLVTQPLYSQWTNQNPVPNGNHLWSTFFVDDNTGWIVGSNGFIKKTTNAGLDWIQQISGTTLTLKSIQFLTENTGWICGDSGLVIRTTDGGTNWFQLTTDTSAMLNDLHFVSSNVGYVAGASGIILKTTDSGISWNKQSSGTINVIYSIDFIDEQLGYAVGNNNIFLKTTDGGSTWSNKTVDLINNTKIFNCVEFIDSNTGWIGTEGQYLNHSGIIIKTTDGGDTWTTTNLYTPISDEAVKTHNYDIENSSDNQRGVRSIMFKDSNTGFAVGGSIDGWWRKIFTTTDAGVTWQTKYGYSEQTGLISVFVNSAGKGFAVGYYGVIYITEDNGFSWSQILSGSQRPQGYTGDWIYTINMLDEDIGWAAGKRKGINFYPIILKTTTGGKIWKTIYEKNTTLNDPYNEIFFISEHIGWVSGVMWGTLKTTDGGVSWSLNDSPSDEIFFINQDTGWTTFSNSEGIRKTTDGGSNWTQKSSTPNTSITFIDINNGWAAGDAGSISKSTDEGESWNAKSSGTTQDLNSIRFSDINNGISVGNSGTALYSSDGGENWNSLNAGTSNNLNSVSFINPSSLWISGESGLIQSSTDIGTTWTIYSGLEGNLTSLQFVNSYTGWVVNESNSIYKYYVEPIPTITLTNPNGYEIWKSGTTKNITWTSEYVSNVNLYFSTNGGSNWNTIATGVDGSSGSYDWTIPILTWFINLNCKVKVEDATNHSIYDESDNSFIIWHFCNIIQYANLGQRTIDFLETDIDISLNVTTSDNISVTYYPYETPAGGSLPSGVVVLSDYYWQVTSSSLIFSDGKMIVPVSALRGVTDATKLVWLKRTNSGEDWENIGGTVVGDNLESTVPFSTFSEFAIGSIDSTNPLPVELYSFEAQVKELKVNLEWITKTEVKNYGFDVERNTGNSWQKIGFVQGFGNSNSPKSYSFVDEHPFGAETFQYRLKQLDTDGQFEYSNIIEVEILPYEFSLNQNYPNPFNPSTVIRFAIPEQSNVNMSVYNLLGELIKTIVDEELSAGYYEYDFQATDLSSGVYIYRIKAGDFVETKKMVLMK